jgi:hypothetical protein
MQMMIQRQQCIDERKTPHIWKTNHKWLAYVRSSGEMFKFAHLIDKNLLRGICYSTVIEKEMVGGEKDGCNEKGG